MQRALVGRCSSHFRDALETLKVWNWPLGRFFRCTGQTSPHSPPTNSLLNSSCNRNTVCRAGEIRATELSNCAISKDKVSRVARSSLARPTHICHCWPVNCTHGVRVVPTMIRRVVMMMKIIMMTMVMVMTMIMMMVRAGISGRRWGGALRTSVSTKSTASTPLLCLLSPTAPYSCAYYCLLPPNTLPTTLYTLSAQCLTLLHPWIRQHGR